MKYVALSDLHLGQTGLDNTGQYSVLSSGDPGGGKSKIGALRDTIETFRNDDQVSLVLVGDSLDLSLAYIRTCLEEFVNLLDSLPKFSEIIYIPGNHDHHLWTMHCEHQNVTDRLDRGFLPKSGSVYQATKSTGEGCSLLEKILKTRVRLAYPTFQLGDIQFTHGHLFGGLYTYISDILEPFLLEEVSYPDYRATVNIALIELIYWFIGETGQGMGADGVMEAIFMDIKKGKKGKLHEGVKRAVDVLLPDGIVKGIPDSWERALVKWAGRNLIDELVKEPKPLSSLDRHQPSEQSRELAKKWMANSPQECQTLVVGHTHVSDDFQLDEDTEIFNLGSWLVEPDDPNPDSRVLLIDGEDIELRRV